MIGTDALGDELGPYLADVHIQKCGWMTDGFPCAAPAVIHGAFPDGSTGFGCTDHRSELVQRCDDWHELDGPCGFGPWVEGDPSRCEFDFDGFEHSVNASLEVPA